MGNFSSIVDMDITTFSNRKTGYIEDKCHEITKLHSENDDEVIDMVFKLFGEFTEKYTLDNIQNNDLINFRKDGKILFSLLYKVLNSDELREEMKNYDDMNHDEINEYENFIINLEYIINNIDTVDLINEAKLFKISCNICKDYLNKKINDMNSLKNSLDELNNSLKKLQNHLELSIN
jgi:hypothetical protein